MAAQTQTNKVAVDFNAMIQADREKRKAETLAQQIFGRNRRQSAPNGSAGIRKGASGGSLASRIGPAKPAQRQPIVSRGGGSVAARYARNAPAATSNIDKAWTHDLHSPKTSTPTGPRPKKEIIRAARLASALNTASTPNLNSQVNIVKGNKGGFSIKGIAGPCVVQAENFAPGTTAADIESAMLTVGGKVLKTSLIATSPRVIAEVIMESRDAGNAVVDTFNGQTADGRILKLFVKPGEVTMADIASSQPSTISPAIPSGPRASRASQRSDLTSDHSSRPDLVRAPSIRTADNYRPSYDPRERDSRNEIIDGSYGFGDEDRMDTDETPRQLYSDNLIPQNNGPRNANGNTPIPRGPAAGGRSNGRGGGRGRGYGYR